MLRRPDGNGAYSSALLSRSGSLLIQSTSARTAATRNASPAITGPSRVGGGVPPGAAPGITPVVARGIHRTSPASSGVTRYLLGRHSVKGGSVGWRKAASGYGIYVSCKV
jgi:hypothetical protein